MGLNRAKYLIGAAAVVLPLQAFALDFTPDATRILSDPNYLPLGGQIYDNTAYTHTWTNFDSINDLNDRFSSTHADMDLIDEFLGYGITDDIMVDASIRYEPDMTRKVDFASGPTVTRDSSGFSDPTFGATWRALDQAVFPVNFDVFGAYSPNWISARNPSGSDSGNFASGGQQGTVGAALGEETRDFSIRGALSAVFIGTREAIDLSNDSPVKSGSHTNYVASLQTQTRLDPLFAVDAGLSYTVDSNSTVANAGTGISYLSHPGNIAGLNAGLNYQLVPNQAVIGLTYAYNNYSSARNIYAVSSDDTETRNKNENVLGVRLYYAFP